MHVRPKPLLFLQTICSLLSVRLDNFSKLPLRRRGGGKGERDREKEEEGGRREREREEEEGKGWERGRERRKETAPVKSRATGSSSLFLCHLAIT